MYRVRLLDGARQELAKLDVPVAHRILKRVAWLAEHLEDVRLESLTGDLTGFFKLRVGDYRVLYETLAGERLIVIHKIGHRRDVYKQR